MGISYLKIIAPLLLGINLYAEGGIPKIAVEGKSRIDFGNYPAKERKEALYKLVNRGNGLLKFGKIRKTCGCAEAKTDKPELKPGESTILKAVILADSIYGPYSKNVYVETNDPKQRFLTLTLAGRAIPLLKVKPKDTIYAGRLSLNKPWKQAFLLVATESGIEVKEPKLECNYPVKVNFIDPKNGKFRLELSMTPKKANGDLKCKIKVPIKKPEGWKPIAITVTGKVGMQLQVLPGTVIFKEAKLTTRNFKLRLLGSRGKPESDKIQLPKIDGVKFSLETAQRNVLPLTVTFSQEFIKNAAQGKILKIGYSGAQAGIIRVKKK